MVHVSYRLQTPTHTQNSLIFKPDVQFLFFSPPLRVYESESLQKCRGSKTVLKLQASTHKFLISNGICCSFLLLTFHIVTKRKKMKRKHKQEARRKKDRKYNEKGTFWVNYRPNTNLSLLTCIVHFSFYSNSELLNGQKKRATQAVHT